MVEIKQTKIRKIQKTREQILQAAENLFRSIPFELVTMEEIADKAILSKATVYNYYQSKDVILIGIHEHKLRNMQPQLSQIIEIPKTGMELLLKLADSLIDALIKNPLTNKITHHFLQLNIDKNNIANEILEKRKKGFKKRANKQIEIEEMMADYLEQLHFYEDIWKKIIEKGFKDKSIKSDFNAGQLTQYIFLVINGVLDQVSLKQHCLNSENISVHQIKQHLLLLIKKIIS